MGADLLVIWGEDSLDAVYPVKRHVGMPGRGARSCWVGLHAKREQGNVESIHIERFVLSIALKQPRWTT